MKLGMVGLPNVGKSTLFNALTNAGAESANYPFCTIEPNVGVVSVPDRRLEFWQRCTSPRSSLPQCWSLWTLPDWWKGLPKAKAWGNQFLGDIREVDAIVHVVRCFEDDNIVHVSGKIGPKRDIETINLELIYSDLEILQRRIDENH